MQSSGYTILSILSKCLPSNSEDESLIPGWGGKIPQASQQKKKKKHFFKKMQYYKKFSKEFFLKKWSILKKSLKKKQ